MAVLGGVASAAGGLAGLLGGAPASNVPVPASFTMPNMGGAASGAYGGIQNLPGAQTSGQFLPWAVSGTSGALNNPWIGPASNMGINNAFNTYGLGNVAAGYGEALLPYAQSVIGTGFDPQGALYARTLQQIQDQSRAANEAAGVGTTPYGAGLENQAVGNFNINWQNAQLQRQLDALQGAGGATSTGIQGIMSGLGLTGGAPGQLVSSALLPYSTGLQDISALTGVTGGVQGLGQVPIQDYLSYLGQGTQQQQANTQLFGQQLNQANLGFGENLAYGKMIGGGLGAFSPTPFNQNPWGNSMIGGAFNNWFG